MRNRGQIFVEEPIKTCGELNGEQDRRSAGRRLSSLLSRRDVAIVFGDRTQSGPDPVRAVVVSRTSTLTLRSTPWSICSRIGLRRS
jgi:hypothetical protein